MTSSSPDLTSLIIPVYNQLHYTEQCLDALYRCTDPPCEIIVVDNGSTDGTSTYLRSQQVTVITNPTNLGCAKAWNQGVRASRGTVVGILNNDIVVTPGWLKHLLEFMSRAQHGIVSPAAREGRLDYELDRYAIDFVRDCRAATRDEIYGACMIIRRAVFDRIGLFDEGFAYGGCEDIDFLWRARKAGFSVGMTGSVLIHHFAMVTQDAIKSTETKAYPLQNLSHFQSKWNRTVRGNWATRRYDDFKASIRKRFEKIRYGHTLVEKDKRG